MEKAQPTPEGVVGRCADVTKWPGETGNPPDVPAQAEIHCAAAPSALPCPCWEGPNGSPGLEVILVRGDTILNTA